MKVRNGFVSNSSSSSFVVLLPENFIEKINYEEVTGGDEDFPLETFKELLNQLINDGSLWDEEIYDIEVDGDYDLHDSLTKLLRPYVIADMDTSSDAGQICIADTEKVKKILSLQ